MTTTNLRQAETKITVAGVLASKNLEKTTGNDGSTVISGDLIIKVDDINSIRFKVYCGEKKKDGTKNKAFDGLVTVMNEYKSIADVGEENADYVYVGSGQFNTYRNPNNGQDVTSYQSNFFSRAKAREPKREWKAEMYILRKTPEVDKEGEETGRLKIRGIAPNYNGIDIIDFIVPSDLADQVDGLLEVKTTFVIYGDIVNSRVEKKVEMLIGKPRTEYEYKNELILTGIERQVEEPNAYDPDAIQLAIQEYENKANAPKAEAPAKKPTAAGTGRTLGF